MRLVTSWLVAVAWLFAAAGSETADTGPPRAAAPIVITGQVSEAATTRPVRGAIVRVGGDTLGRDVETDADGRFLLKLPPGQYPLEVRAAGYLSLSHTLAVSGDVPPAPLELRLVREIRRTETLDVAAQVGEEEGPQTQTLAPTAVSSVAGGGENVFRVVTTLPGVVSAHWFQSRFAVRGGGPDENLVVMDGVEIHNPFRLAGAFSAFSPEIVERFELVSAVFPPAYGDRLSSLLLVETRDGPRDRPFTGSAGLGLADSDVTLGGRLPHRWPGSWLVSGRRTYYDVIAERFTKSNLPGFGDLFTKVAVEPRPGARLALTTLVGGESADMSFAYSGFGNEQAGTMHSRNRLIIASARWPLSTRLSGSVAASAYRTREDIAGQNDRPESHLTVERGVSIEDLALRSSLSAQIGASGLVQLGSEWHRIRSRWQWSVAGLLPTDAWQQATAGGPSVWGQGLTTPVDSTLDATRGALWLAARLPFGRRTTVEPALRLDHSSVNGRTPVAPRLHTTTDLGHGMRLRTAVGILTQSPGYEKVLQSQYFVQLGWPTISSLPGDLTPPPVTPPPVTPPPSGPPSNPGEGVAAQLATIADERSSGAFVGLERALAHGLNARVEVFYRWMDHLVVGRLETDEERQARLSRYDFPPELTDQLPTQRQITRFPESDGRGQAYGFDVFLSKESGRLRGWASYTFGVSRRTAYGLTYPADFDARHSVGLSGEARLSPTLRLGLTARVASGLPHTPVSEHVEVVPDTLDQDGDGNREELIPARNDDGSLRYVRHQEPGDLTLMNSERQSPYARIDARLSWNPHRGRWLFYLDVINILNRHVNDYTMMPIVPSIGVHTRF